MTRYTARHREQLPVLAQMAKRVETVHFGDDHVPGGLCDLLLRKIGDIKMHMKKAELILFPTIRKGEISGIEQLFAMMRPDHDDHAAQVAEIRGRTGCLALPKDACGTWKTLYIWLGGFLTDLEEYAPKIRRAFRAVRASARRCAG